MVQPISCQKLPVGNFTNFTNVAISILYVMQGLIYSIQEVTESLLDFFSEFVSVTPAQSPILLDRYTMHTCTCGMTWLHIIIILCMQIIC